MPNTKKLHPEKWFIPYRPVADAQLKADESLAMAMMFSLEIGGQEMAHAVFCVIRKGDKVIARNIICHADAGGYCGGHADDTAEYDLSDEQAMISEARNQVLEFASKLIMDTSTPITLDPTKPIFYVQTKMRSNDEVYEKLMANNDPDSRLATEVITHVLGLKAKAPEPIKQEIKVEQPNVDEAALIKKFGKKNMESLAKKMNYKGSIINKSNQTHE